MTGRDRQLILMMAGFAVIVVLRHTAGGVSSGLRALAFAGGLLLITVGVIGLPSRPKRRHGVTLREAPHSSSVRRWAVLLVRIALPIVVLVVPVALIDATAGVVFLAVIACVVVGGGFWHVRSSRARGVPKSERWQKRHVRRFEVPVSLDHALALAEKELQAELGADIEDRTASELFATTAMGRWRSGQQITVAGLSSGENSSQITISSEQDGGGLDGGLSWTIVTSLERMLRERGVQS